MSDSTTKKSARRRRRSAPPPANPATGKAAGSDSPGVPPVKAKRGCLGCLGKTLLLLALLSIPAAFLLNGPVFRAVAKWGVGKGLAKVQLAVAGDFRVEGTLLSGIEIHDLSTQPAAAAAPDPEAPASARSLSPLTDLHIGLAEVRYHVAPLLRRDYLGAIDLVRLHRVGADIELPPVDEIQPKAPDKKNRDPNRDPLAALWAALEISYDIDDVSVRVSRAGENVASVEGLRLRLLPDTAGELGFSKLKIGTSLERENISAPLTVSDDRLSLGRFEPIDGLAIERLTVNREGADQLTALLDLAGGRVSVGLERDRSLSAELRDGSIDLGALMRQLGAEKAISSGNVDALKVDFLGDFKQPATWTGNGRLAVAGLTFPGQSLDQADLDFDIQAGRLSATLDALRSGASAELKVAADISAADSPAGIAGLPLSATLNVAAGAVENFIPPAQREKVPVSGAATLTAEATLTPKPWRLHEGSTATLSSDSLKWRAIPVQSLTLDVTALADDRFAAQLDLALDAANRVAVDGEIGIGQLDYNAEVSASVETNSALKDLLNSFGFEKELAANADLTWRGEGVFKPAEPNTAASHEGELDLLAREIRIAEGRTIDRLQVTLAHSPQTIRVGELDLTSGDLSLAGNGSYGLTDHLIDVPALNISRDGESIASGSLKLPYDPAAMREKGAVGFFNQKGDIDIAFQSADLRLEELIAMTGKQSPVQGGITANIDLHGAPAELKGGVSVRANDLKATAAPDVPAGDIAIDLSIADQRIGLSGRLDHPQIEPITLDGTLPFTPEAWASGEAKLTDAPLELRAHMAPSSLDFVRGYVPGIEKIDASAALDLEFGGTLAKPEASGTLKLVVDEFHMENRKIPSVQEGNVQIRAEGRTLTIDTFEALVSGGKVTLGGDVSFPTDGSGPLFDLRLNVAAGAVENFIPPAQREKIPVSGAATLTAEATLTPKPWRLHEGSTATLSSDSLKWRAIPVQSLTLDATALADDRFAAQLDLALDDSNRVAVDGEIGIRQLDYDAEVSASVETTSAFKNLLNSFGFEKALAGNADLTWRGEGAFKPAEPNTAASHEGELDLLAREIRIAEGRTIDRLQVTVAHSPQAIRVGELDLTSGDLSLGGKGSYDLTDHLIDVPALDISRDGKSIASGSLKLPYDPAAMREKGAAGFFGQQGEIDIDFQSADLRLEELIALTGKESPVQGGITASIDLRGTPQQPKGGVSVRATDLKATAAPDVPPGDLAIDLAIADDRVELNGRFSHPQIEPLTVDGSLPFTPEAWTTGEAKLADAPIQLKANMPSSSLDFVRSYVPGIEKIDASAAVDLNVTGTIGKPEVTGALKLVVGEFHMENRMIPSVHEGLVEIRAEGRTLTIDTFEALVSGGKVTLGGSVTFPGTEPDPSVAPGSTGAAGPVFDLTLNAREALIARAADYNIRADTDLSLTGPWATAALQGEIALVNSRYVKSIDILPISMPGRDRSDLPDIEKRPAAIKVPRKLDFKVEKAPFRDWTVDVKVITRDPFIVRGNLARIDAVSDVRITGTGGAPVPNGRIYITEGRLTLPFSKVDIQKGEVVFNENTGFNGELDIQATAEVRQYDINIYVYDRLTAPKNVLTSDPPLPNEDIVSLLATGTTREELTGGSGSVAASKAALLFLKKLRDDDIDPDEDPNFLEQLNERTTLDIGQTDPRTGESTIAGRIRLFRQLFLVANVSAEGDYRGLLKYIFQFR